MCMKIKSLERETNLDLLRVLSMFAVITIHISGTWVGGFTQKIEGGVSVSLLTHPLIACIYNSTSRFAVPCFFMITGAFTLSSEKNSNYNYFYKKTFNKLGPTLISFWVLYVLYGIIMCFVCEDAAAKILILIKSVISGAPMYHMWYMTVLIGIYIFIPMVLLFKNTISEVMFSKIALMYFIIAMISRWTSDAKLDWDIGQCFEYLGYVIIGYVLYINTKKNTKKGLILITIGILVEIFTALIQYRFSVAQGIIEEELEYKIVQPYCPSIVLASILIFIGFLMITIRKNRCIEILSKLSFLVYLFHAGVYDYIKTAFALQNNFNNYDCLIAIPILVGIVFAISFFLSLAYKKISKWIQYLRVRNFQ